jgi:hypothetical protein
MVDFMFQLPTAEFEDLRLQIATSSWGERADFGGVARLPLQ